MNDDFNLKIESVIRLGQILTAIVAMLTLIALALGYAWLFTADNPIARRVQCGWQGKYYDACDPAWLVTPEARK